MEGVDIVDLVGRYTRLKKVGSRYVGLCPFHAEKTPSFSVHPQRGFFHCFGCQASGDATSFLMKIEGKTFHEASDALSSGNYGPALPDYFKCSNEAWSAMKETGRAVVVENGNDSGFVSAPALELRGPVLSDEHARTLSMYCDRAVIVYHETGWCAALRASEALLRNDVAPYLSILHPAWSESADKVKVDDAKPALEVFAKAYSGLGSKGIALLSSLVNACQDRVRRGAYIAWLAEVFHVSRHDVVSSLAPEVTP